MNEELVTILKALLSDTVVLKFKAHGYHWNAEGDDFPQFHSFFGDIYEDYESAIDIIAEWIRKLDAVAPSDLLYFYNNSSITESITSLDPCEMAKDLLISNDQIIPMLSSAVTKASQVGQHALANFFAERMDMHQRWHWMLGSVARDKEEE
jgi:starvation-inducible DNA-binding protein